MTKKIYSKQAVSEVVGVILLLGMTLTLFVILNTFVFQFSFDTSAPAVNLIGTIDYSNDMINIEHNGGESLEGTTHIIIMIGSDTYSKNTTELLIDTNHNNKWNFGETVQFNFKEIDITDKYVRVMVVNPETNTLLLSVVLQNGLS